MKSKLTWIGIVTGLVLLLVAFVSRNPTSPDFESARELIVLRKVAHEVLKSVGDSSSRVPEIKRITETEYLIPFQLPFSFLPDSLVNTIRDVFNTQGLNQGYIVNVKEQQTGTVVFGYAMSVSGQEDLVPCRGRHQSLATYTLHIQFNKTPALTGQNLLVGSAAIGLAALLFAGWKRSRPIAEPVSSSSSSGVQIGNFWFEPAQQTLRLEDHIISLTVKEARLLSIFSEAMNQLIDRKKLQKEVWEDEGVIVGRSLDMFISKLRKKLEADPSVQLVNVHGKGYKLEVQF